MKQKRRVIKKKSERYREAYYRFYVKDHSLKMHSRWRLLYRVQMKEGFKHGFGRQD